MRPGEGRSAGTGVTPERTRAQIETVLRRYGATGFAAGWQETPQGRQVALQFELSGRRYRLPIRLPAANDRRYTHSPGGKARTPAQVQNALDQAERQAWREMLHLVEAILIAVDRGIIRMDEALLSWMIVPTGQTVGEWVEPQVEQVYATGRMPALLPGFTPPALGKGES